MTNDQITFTFYKYVIKMLMRGVNKRRNRDIRIYMRMVFEIRSIYFILFKILSLSLNKNIRGECVIFKTTLCTTPAHTGYRVFENTSNSSCPKDSRLNSTPSSIFKLLFPKIEFNFCKLWESIAYHSCSILSVWL